MIRNKTIKFNMDKPEDKALWEWLQQRPHGMFSEMTKRIWRDTMEKNIQVDEYIARDNNMREEKRNARD